MCIKPKPYHQPSDDPVNDQQRCILSFLINHGYEILSFSDNRKETIHITADIIASYQDWTIKIEINMDSDNDLIPGIDSEILFTENGTPRIIISSLCQFIRWHDNVFREELP